MALNALYRAAVALARPPASRFLGADGKRAGQTAGSVQLQRRILAWIGLKHISKRRYGEMGQ
eukprot:scaffold241_cov242-Pinguiococcus_pyrenoidosus.AAC.23